MRRERARKKHIHTHTKQAAACEEVQVLCSHTNVNSKIRNQGVEQHANDTLTRSFILLEGYSIANIFKQMTHVKGFVLNSLGVNNYNLILISRKEKSHDGLA